jgi:predicted esterase
VITAHIIQTPTHGRYLLRPPSAPEPAPLIVGFHGYAETAETQFDRLASIDGADKWWLLSIQGLHCFYRGRSEDVVSSWMTRQNRERALADNRQYISSVIERVVIEHGVRAPLVFAGFSQGVAMAFRAAVASPGIAVVALGGDVPPELAPAELARLRGVLLGRGIRDEWYSSSKAEEDHQKLRAAGVAVELVTMNAAHEWTAEFSVAAGDFLRRLSS